MQIFTCKLFAGRDWSQAEVSMQTKTGREALWSHCYTGPLQHQHCHKKHNTWPISYHWWLPKTVNNKGSEVLSMFRLSLQCRKQVYFCACVSYVLMRAESSSKVSMWTEGKINSFRQPSPVGLWNKYVPISIHISQEQYICHKLMPF